MSIKGLWATAAATHSILAELRNSLRQLKSDVSQLRIDTDTPMSIVHGRVIPCTQADTGLEPSLHPSLLNTESGSQLQAIPEEGNHPFEFEHDPAQPLPPAHGPRFMFSTLPKLGRKKDCSSNAACFLRVVSPDMTLKTLWREWNEGVVIDSRTFLPLSELERQRVEEKCNYRAGDDSKVKMQVHRRKVICQFLEENGASSDAIATDRAIKAVVDEMNDAMEQVWKKKNKWPRKKGWSLDQLCNYRSKQLALRKAAATHAATQATEQGDSADQAGEQGDSAEQAGEQRDSAEQGVSSSCQDNDRPFISAGIGLQQLSD